MRLTWLFISEGVLFLGLGLPMALRKIPPNSMYGFRTVKTLSSPEIWYATNRSMGIDLCIAGGVIALAAAVLHKALRAQPPQYLSLANVGVMTVALTAVLVKGILQLRRL